MAKMRDRAHDLRQAQKRAHQYVIDYLGKHAIPLPTGMDEDAYKVAMDAVVQAMGSAYASGYIDGAEGK